jgi:Arc/MetJ family transcription regulator
LKPQQQQQEPPERPAILDHFKQPLSLVGIVNREKVFRGGLMQLYAARDYIAYLRGVRERELAALDDQFRAAVMDDDRPLLASLLGKRYAVDFILRELTNVAAEVDAAIDFPGTLRKVQHMQVQQDLARRQAERDPSFDPSFVGGVK